MENIYANKTKVLKFYNKRVRLKRLVWKVKLLIGTRIPKFGKWSPTWEGPFIVTQVVYGGAYKLFTLEGEELAKSINRKYLKKYYPMIGIPLIFKEEQSTNHKLAE